MLLTLINLREIVEGFFLFGTRVASHTAVNFCDYELEQLYGLISFNTNIETVELEHRMRTKE